MSRLDLSDLAHIAIIMDGNGRWARQRGLRRTHGHREGVAAVREVTTECARAHLPWLTLYALSTENYRNRPPREIRVLMALLRRFMIAERPTLMENDVRLRTLGRVHELPEAVVKAIRETEELTSGNKGMVLALALNYGGRAEITDGVRKVLLQAMESGSAPPKDLSEEAFGRYLYLPEMPDVDLLIRTGGEMRISNFLLWQVSYAELVVTSTLWPDFREADLERAAGEYRGRKRRFGGLLEGVDH